MQKQKLNAQRSTSTSKSEKESLRARNIRITEFGSHMQRTEHGARDWKMLAGGTNVIHSITL